MAKDYRSIGEVISTGFICNDDEYAHVEDVHRLNLRFLRRNAGAGGKLYKLVESQTKEIEEVMIEYLGGIVI